MNLKKSLRRLNHLLYLIHPPFYFSKEELKEKIEKDKIFIQEYFKQNQSTQRSEGFMNRLELYSLIDKLKLPSDEVATMWWEARKQAELNKIINTGKPVKEGRDNKGVYVGGGGSNKNMIRYPSTKRSSRVWKIFYSMFPWAAKRDEWDGKESIRFKKK